MAGFPRILKNPCASKENRFPKLNLPTVYQRNRRAKLAVNTQTPVHCRFCHRTGVFLLVPLSERFDNDFNEVPDGLIQPLIIEDTHIQSLVPVM